MKTEFETPVAFCVFNRPDLTERVFAQIAKLRPTSLLVISDGPRKDHPTDEYLVEQTREIATAVDWDCDLRVNFSDVNLGCGQRMASGISWAFAQFEELIILEDDCLPNDSFFKFCHQLLDRYRDEPRVMMISGDNFQPYRRSSASYYYSLWPHIWGWASWRRAWKSYDLAMSQWPAFRDSDHWNQLFSNDRQRSYWRSTLESSYRGDVDTWDYAWTFAIWKNRGLTILPEQNLVANLGFGSSATHTTDADSPLAEMGTFDLGSLVHPDLIQRSIDADDWTFENVFCPPPVTAPSRRRAGWKDIFSRYFPRTFGAKAG